METKYARVPSGDMAAHIDREMFLTSPRPRHAAFGLWAVTREDYGWFGDETALLLVWRRARAYLPDLVPWLAGDLHGHAQVATGGRGRFDGILEDSGELVW
jgi:hypothetical protein